VGLAAYWRGLDVRSVETAPGCRVMQFDNAWGIEDLTADDAKKLCGCGDQLCVICSSIGVLP